MSIVHHHKQQYEIQTEVSAVYHDGFQTSCHVGDHFYSMYLWAEEKKIWGFYKNIKL